MENKEFQLRYLPLFEHDSEESVEYISNVLCNFDAALNLVDEVEISIKKRLYNPTSFEPYQSVKKRELPYYPIYVKNYIVFYVVIGNVMEVRRFIYGKRDIESIL
jgi:hypothetical protein